MTSSDDAWGDLLVWVARGEGLAPGMSVGHAGQAHTRVPPSPTDEQWQGSTALQDA